MKNVFLIIMIIYAGTLMGAASYNISYTGILHSFEEYVGDPEYSSISSYGLSYPGILHSFDVYGSGYSCGYSEVGLLTSLETGLYGQVYDNLTGEGIEGAYVIVTRPLFIDEYNTDEEGNYEFPGISEGTYNLLVTASGYQQRNMSVIVEEGVNIVNISMQVTGGGTGSLIITNELIAYADNIEEVSRNVFILSGNVSINNKLFYEAEIEIDKRAVLNHPEITGNCAYGVVNNGDNEIIKQENEDFAFYAVGDRLIPFNNVYNDLSPLVGGFSIKCGIITFHNDYLEVGALAEMPYPIDQVFEYIQENATGIMPLYLEEISGALHYYANSPVEKGFDIDDLQANFMIFAIHDLDIYYNSSEELFGGGFKLKIPGIPENLRGETSEEFADVKVTIVDENGKYRDKTSLTELIEIQRLFGAEFLEIGMQMEFIQGALNSLVISVSSDIPIGTTGLFITEMAGGVEDLQTENWLILASVDIETGLEVPVLGPAVKLEDLSARIHPMNYFYGSGGIEVFSYELSEGFIEFDGQKNAFNAEGVLNLADMIYGRQYTTISYGYFEGGGTMIVSTPTDLPWFLNWAENITFGSADVEVNSFYMQSQFEYYGLSLAQRAQYGKQTFPWFHYYLGGNYENLYQIWRGMREGRQVITFEVPPNTGQLLVVAGNDIELFDYELETPGGLIYNEDNCNYNQFESSLQTVVVIDNPQAGDWDFVTDEEGEIIAEFSCLDQQPTTLVSQPESRGMRNNTVSLSFNDYSDTLRVQVYYDTDNSHYDGVMIQEFELVNNSELEFEWYNEEIPDGEYFIYTRISDNANAPVLQYAPGSIIIDNVDVEVPQNVSAVQDGEVVNVSWSEPVSDDIYLAKVYYEDNSNGFVDVKCVAGDNETSLIGLTEGHPYNVYAVFLDAEYNESDPSEVVELVYYSAQRNNPPYLLMDDEIVYDFIADEYGEIELLGGDADGDNLSYSVLDNDIGLNISGDILSWTPLHEDRGVHIMKIVASDGILADTTSVQLSVLTQEQAAVQLKFNSPNLFEEDNMYVKLKNFRCEDIEQSVALENMVTGESEELVLRKVNKFDYIGEFELSFRSRTLLWVANGDTIKAEYQFEGETYQAFAVYDSLAQYSDEVAPDVISDLDVVMGTANDIILNWTATGDDGYSGNAYHYDIRYSGEPVITEDDYLWAQQVECSLYPAEAGEAEEYAFNISELENIAQYDSLFFVIKVEDEMQNWSLLSNQATLRFLSPPSDVAAELQEDFVVDLTWEGNNAFRNEQSRQEVEFMYYNIYRSRDGSVLLPLVTNIEVNSYCDTLFLMQDGEYVYAVQAVYNSGNSGRVTSNPIELERYVDLRVLCTLNDTSSYGGISFTLTGLDSVYAQTFEETTNVFGLLLLADVYKTDYEVIVQKADYLTICDTITVDDNNYVFSFELQRLLYGDIDLNGVVESFDASLVLQYFVQMEPQGVPLPWAGWLLEKADVDGNGAVEAYDASLILMYAVDLIDIFPVEERTRK